MCKLKQSIVCFARALGSEKAFASGMIIMTKKEHSEKDCSLKGPDDSRMGNDVSVKATRTSELFSCGGAKEGERRREGEAEKLGMEKRCSSVPVGGLQRLQWG